MARSSRLFKLGDRVRILEGRWAGCVGELLAFDYDNPFGITLFLVHTRQNEECQIGWYKEEHIQLED